MLESLADSFALVLQPGTLLLMVVGVGIGFVVGILPGLGGAVTLALMIPFTYSMSPVEAVAFLVGMISVLGTTGDITSVLFGVPGEAASAAVVLDGYPMTRKGQAGRALGAVLASSAVGAIFGALVLLAAIPIMRPLILAFGPAEFLMITLLGLTFVVALSGKNLLKGFIMAALGILVALVGVDPVSGVPRLTFDSLYLYDGIDLVPVVVGLFGGAELLQLMLTKESIGDKSARGVSAYAGIGQGALDTFRHWWLVIRCSAIGVAVGILPGLGGSVSQFIAYGHAQQTSKHPELFGKGSMEGLLAAGSNNNAKTSGSLIPTIAFGIPGSVGAAVLLGAFLVVGIQPGPEMLTTNLDVTLSIVWVTVFASLLAVLISLPVIGPLTRLTYVPGFWLVPFLLILLTLGAFTASNSMGDVVVMIIAAVVGVGCLRFDWPRVPFLLAVVLGSLIERYLFLSISLYDYEWLTTPGVLVIAALMVVVAVGPMLRNRRKARAAAREQAATPDADTPPDGTGATTTPDDGGIPTTDGADQRVKGDRHA
ncbi:MAG: Tripartite tricarboxylate transporter TctA family protein [Blastococcus sp.]|nr:Tripartite tricarboxylate transporter TctA family protein [Blastococcus sp.]